jgi:8-oxo-dGTP diphosphatase
VILREDRVLLLEHRKLGCWLYPGGHVEPNEDPVQAVRREVREEVGLEVDIVSDERFSHPDITVVEPPFTIMVEDIPDPDGAHQHIDLIYVCTPRDSSDAVADGNHDIEYDGYRWVPLADLASIHTTPELPALATACARYAAGKTTTVRAPQGNLLR